MSKTVTIRMELRGADEVRAAKELLLHDSSGLTESDGNVPTEGQWNADPGMWLNITALVVSSVGAAESIFNLSRMFAKRKTGEEKPSAGLTIIVDGTAYRIEEIKPEAIERLISE